MKAVCSSETSVATYKLTWRYNPTTQKINMYTDKEIYIQLTVPVIAAGENSQYWLP